MGRAVPLWERASSLPTSKRMDGLGRDLRHGLRMLVRTPLLSAVAILTVGLGVGATTFVFSVVWGTLFAGPPLPVADRLVLLVEARPAEGQDQVGLPWADYLDFVEAQTSFEHLEGQYGGTVNLAGDAGPPERFQGAFVTPGFLSMTGVTPALGRTFVNEEGLTDATPVVVVGWDAWQNRFAGDPDVVGSTVRMNGETAEIVGVMPDGFHFPFNQDLWVALRRGLEAGGDRRAGTFVQAAGVLREDVSVETATAEAEAIARRLEAEHPEANEGITARVIPYVEGYTPEQIRSMMLLMVAMVLGVLLVAGANVANVLLARAAVREREVAIRSAMGAWRWRVVQQLLAEAVALGVGGALVGAGLAFVGLELFQASVEGVNKPYWMEWSLDGPALLFTSAVALAAAVAAGTVPAFRASGAAISSVLRDESRGSSSLRVGRLATGLVVGELAVSCGLMIAAGLMAQSLIALNHVELGFEPEGVLTARMGLFETDYPTPDERNRFFHEVLDALAQEPEMLAASISSALPGSGGGGVPVQVDGESYVLDVDIPRARSQVVSVGYFDTHGIPVLEGRAFERAESVWGGEPVAVVNRSFASRFLGGGSVLGRRIRTGGLDAEGPWSRIVGVVDDVYAGTGAFGGGGQRAEAIYLSMGGVTNQFMSLSVRTFGEASSVAGLLRRTVAAADPNLPLYWVRTQEENLRLETFMHRLFSSLFGIFGVAALFLAAVGLYGVIDFSVSNRVREMGVRVAMGAARPDIVRLVLGNVVRQLVVGMALGVGLGFVLAVPLSSTMFGVRRFDPFVYAGIVLTLTVVALVATLRPLRRALSVDPVVALRA